MWGKRVLSTDEAGDGNGHGASRGCLLADERSGVEWILSRERLRDLTGCGHCTAGVIAKEEEEEEEEEEEARAWAWAEAELREGEREGEIALRARQKRKGPRSFKACSDCNGDWPGGVARVML